MTLVDIALLNAALAERDAAREEGARLRAAVEGALPVCYLFRESPDPAHTYCLNLVGGTFPNDAVFTADMCCDPCKVRAALAVPTADDGAERGAR